MCQRVQSVTPHEINTIVSKYSLINNVFPQKTLIMNRPYNHAYRIGNEWKTDEQPKTQILYGEWENVWSPTYTNGLLMKRFRRARRQHQKQSFNTLSLYIAHFDFPSQPSRRSQTRRHFTFSHAHRKHLAKSKRRLGHQPAAAVQVKCRRVWLMKCCYIKLKHIGKPTKLLKTIYRQNKELWLFDGRSAVFFIYSLLITIYIFLRFGFAQQNIFNDRK